MSAHTNQNEAHPLTLLTLPQELLDMIIKSTFENTTVYLSRFPRPASLPNDVATKRNGALLLTCSRLHFLAKRPYYLYSIFHCNRTFEAYLFLRTPKHQHVAERRYIRRINCNFSRNLERETHERKLGSRELGSPIPSHSFQMFVLVKTQRLLDDFAKEMRAKVYGVRVGVLRGCANIGRAKVEGLIAGDVEDEEEEEAFKTKKLNFFLVSRKVRIRKPGKGLAMNS